MSGERVAASGSSPGHEPKCAECGHGKELHPFSDSGRRCTHPTCFCPWYRQPADPVASPADTPERIEQLREKAERHGRVVSDGDETYSESPGWNDVLFLLAVGERDRQRIAQLTAALIRLVNYLGTVGATEDDAIHTLVQQAAAVLSDKEDAGA